jgi:hypothetical protein
VPIQDRDLQFLDSQREQRMGGGGAAAAGADLNDVVHRDSGEFVTESVRKPRYVGGVGDAAAAAKLDRIHGADSFCLVSVWVEKRATRLGVRVGDVDASETQELGCCQHPRQILPIETELRKVEERVDEAQTLCVGFGLVHLRRTRSQNTAAKQPQ